MKKPRTTALILLVALFLGVGAGRVLASPTATLTVEQARAAVAKYFPVGKLLNSHLVDPVGPGANPAWNLTFENGSNALVDGVTGKVTHFSSVPTEATSQGTLTSTLAQQVALNLIGQMYSERLQEIEPDPVRPMLPSGAGFTLLFARVVNGALFPANGFRVTVNPNGSIAQFQTNWQEATSFPPPTGLIGERAALTAARKLLTENPKVFLFYQVVAPAQPPKLFYLVKTATAELALDAQTGLPPGGSPSGHKPSPDFAEIGWAVGIGALWLLSAAVAYGLGIRLGSRRAHHAGTGGGTGAKGGDDPLFPAAG